MSRAMNKSRGDQEVLDKLGLLARLHGVDLYAALNECPARGYNGAIRLEDLVEHIVRVGSSSQEQSGT